MTEVQLQQAVIECARLLGWRVAHFRPARVMRGGREIYETPIAADGRGFPDLCAAHFPQGRVIFAELKSKTGRTSLEQDEWLRVLHRGPAEVYLWTPDDWMSGRIEALLRAPP